MNYLSEVAIEKFELEKKIESIEHQLAMADYRKTLGETVNLKWEHKARFKSKMLKIELKEMNLRFDYIKNKQIKKNKEEIVKKKYEIRKILFNCGERAVWGGSF